MKSFIVRLWRRPEGFKAEARSLTDGENRTFRSLDQLFDYLVEQAEEHRGPDDERGG